MNKNFFKTIILGLVALLIFNITPSVHAVQLENDFSGKMSNLDKKEEQIILKHLKSLKAEEAKNNKKLSKENKKIANDSLKNIEDNFLYAEIHDGVKSIILGTGDAKTFVAVTDDNIEVVQQLSEQEFLINGESHQFEITITESDIQPTDISLSELEVMNSDEVSIQNSRTWTFVGASWINVNAQRAFHTYTASSLGTVITSVLLTFAGVVFWKVTVASLGVGIAYNYVASSEYPTNVGKSHIYRYSRGISPLRDYKTHSQDYAVYQGRNVFLGTSYTYKNSCVGCGV